MSGLDITAENISTGSFTDRQLSDFAGFPVVVFHMSELPHWNLLQQNGNLGERELKEKFAPQLQERVGAMERKLDAADMPTSAAAALAIARYPIVSNNQVEANVPWFAPAIDYRQEANNHWGDIRRRGVDAVTDDAQARYFGPVPGKTMPFVLPGVLSEPLEPFVTGGGWQKLFKRISAVVLVNSNDDPEDFKKNWALELGLPPERVTRFPDPKIHHLISMGHEGEHLRQITFEAVDTGLKDYDYKFDYFIPKYYEEADADLSIHSRLRRVDFGAKDKIDEALTMDRHKRYMGLLFNQPWYWTAPFMDAVEKKEAPPDFYQVHQSVMEIRLRIMAEADRMQMARDRICPVPLSVTSQELNETVAAWRQYPGANRNPPENGKTIAGVGLRPEWMTFEDVIKNGEKKGAIPGIDDIYLAWRETQFFGKPDIFYTLIKKSLTDGAFDPNPLTKKIAGKIVAAAEYFDPTLTAMPDLAAAIHLPSRGYRSSEMQRLARDEVCTPVSAPIPVPPAGYMPKPTGIAASPL